MSRKTISKTQTIIPNGMSEDIHTSESEDEMQKAQEILKSHLVMSDDSSLTETSDDEQQLEPETSKSKKKKKMHWTKKSFVSPTATFTQYFPTPPIDPELEPIDYFYLMFGKESFGILKDQSNLYSVQVNPNRPANISENEIQQFIGILIMSGVYSFPQQRFYWANDTRVQSIASAMSRDRFLSIKKFLHVVDNTNQLNQNDPDYDRAFKVRPLLNIVKENFRKIPKEENLSVDEQIIPFKGRSVMKQHMPKKPNRWGYKMFLLAGGESGICYDFVLYTGKADKPKHGFCTDITLELCQTVPPMMNYKVYCDNYFTTVRLQVELKKLGIFSIGTVRANRLPDLVMKDEKSLKREGRGSMDYRTTHVDGVELCATRCINCLMMKHFSRFLTHFGRMLLFGNMLEFT